MNRMDQVNSERDDFIRKTLQEDKIVTQPILDTFENYIDSSNIKVKKYTYKQKNIIIFLLIILSISICYNIYLSLYHQKNFSTPSQILSSNSTNSESVVINENNKNTNNTTSFISNQTSAENTISNTSITENKTETTTNTTIISNVTSERNTTDEIDITALKDFIEQYGIGINRISYEQDNLESNTILLIIARRYFNSIPAKDIPSDMKDKFILNDENAKAFIKELTGKEFTGDYIKTYSNYINYSAGSDSYVYGKDITNITQEKYTCTDLKIEKLTDSTYTVNAKVERELDEEITLYEVVMEIELNQDYTYQQFKVINLEAKNKSKYPDNTIHLVE